MLVRHSVPHAILTARKRRLAWDRSIQEAQQAEACKPGKGEFSQDQDSIARA